MALIVSLTTIASRLEVCRHACISLANQDHPPDRIVLNVSRAPYLLDAGIDDNATLAWAQNVPSLSLQWVDNTGPYRKLLPILERCNSDDLLVTADDDVIYGRHWLGQLVACAEQHPDAIACGLARRPQRNLFGRLQGYMAWPLVMPGTVGLGLVPIGVAGVAYRPMLLDRGWLRDPQRSVIAPTTDDLWFAESARRKGTPVAVAPGVHAQVHRIAHPDTLFRLNGAARHHGARGPSRLKLRLKSQAGIACCTNDTNYRAIQAHSSRMSETLDLSQ